jgi:hypothetical protein
MPMRQIRRIHRTVIPGGISMAIAGALLMSGCPKGNVAALSITPRTPAVGDTLTIVLDRQTKGHFPAHDELYAITLSRPPEITPANLPPSQSPDAGFKIGDMVVVNGRGEFQTVLQPIYGPDKYGTVLKLEPGTQLDLEIRGPSLMMRRGLPIALGHPGEALSPFILTWDL